MFDLQIGLQNPFKVSGDVKNLFNRWWEVSSHRVLEIQLYVNFSMLLEFNLRLNWTGRDHAGPDLSISFLGLNFDIQLYDTRHWNYETDAWEVDLGEQIDQHLYRVGLVLDKLFHRENWLETVVDLRRHLEQLPEGTRKIALHEEPFNDAVDWGKISKSEEDLLPKSAYSDLVDSKEWMR